MSNMAFSVRVLVGRLIRWFVLAAELDERWSDPARREEVKRRDERIISRVSEKAERVAV